MFLLSGFQRCYVENNCFLLYTVFDGKLVDYRDIVEEIIVQIFEKYGNVYEIPLLLDGIINLYAGKTGKIEDLSQDLHNHIVSNMIHQCWNQRALSPSQAVDAWRSFITAFKWICSIEMDENNDEQTNKLIALRALCNIPLLWNLMAHFLNYVIIDEFNSKICISLINEMRPYLKELLDSLLFQPLFRYLFMDNEGKPRQNAIKLSSTISGGLGHLRRYISDTMETKGKLQSNIADIKLGLNRCNFQINQYFDQLIKTINERKTELQFSLKQFEKARMNPLYKQLENVDAILDKYNHTKQDVINRIMNNAANEDVMADSDDSDQDEDMKHNIMNEEDMEREIMTNIKHSLSKSYRKPKFSTIPHFQNDTEVGDYMKWIKSSGDIYESQIWYGSKNEFVDDEDDETDSQDLKTLELLHDIIYIHVTLNKIYDECEKYDASIQIELHPKLPVFMNNLLLNNQSGKDEMKYSLVMLVKKMEENDGDYMKIHGDESIAECTHGLEYCVLHRIIELYQHYNAFFMDSTNDSVLEQKEELEYLVNWITPKLIHKKAADEDGDGGNEEKDVSHDNLWNDINSIHDDDMMHIFKAISMHSRKSTFIPWFKYLLTDHYLKSMQSKDTMIKVDILCESWFYDIPKVHDIIIIEVINTFHKDLNYLIGEINAKSPKKWLQDIDDCLCKLSLSQFDFEEVKSSKVIQHLKAKSTFQRTQEIMLENIVEILPRWNFLFNYLQSIPHQQLKAKKSYYQQQIFCLSLIFDFMLVRPLMSIIDVIKKKMDQDQKESDDDGDDEDDEDEDEDEMNVEIFEQFAKALYSMFQKVIQNYNLQHTSVK